MRGRFTMAPVAMLGAVLLAALVIGCRTIPEEPPPEPPEEEFDLRLVEVPDDGARVTTDEVPIVISIGTLDPSLIDHILVRVDPDRAFEVVPRITPEGLSFLLPLEGLEDGNRYRFSLFLRLVDGRELPVGDGFTLGIVLGLPIPEPEHDATATLDPTPTLSWWYPALDSETGPDEAEFPAEKVKGVKLLVDGVEVSADTDMESVPPRAARPVADLAGREQMERGVTVTWQVRLVSPRGVLGPLSPAGRVTFDPAANVPAIRSARTGDMTIVSRPGFVWSAVPGAVEYLLEYYPGFGPTDEQEPVLVEGLGSEFFRLPVDDLETIALAGAGSELRWRVQARNRLGVSTPWSETQVLRHTVLAPSIVTVLPAGGTVELVMGAPENVAAARGNERPPIPVLMDRPFGIARNLLTTELVAELFNQGLRTGELVLDGEDKVRDVETDLVLLALAGLDFGAQFGLSVERIETDTETTGNRVAFDPEYRSHPAVGVTWYGAVWLMNRLSLLEARVPVYRWEPVPAGTGFQVLADWDADGYRLPTEAEWALAVGQRERLRSGTENTPVRAFRTLSAIELRGINFLRSGDAWEDPEPPFTRAGGPTSPIGALGIASPAGAFDLMGNVWEWVWDWYHPRRIPPDDRDPEEEPRLPRNYTGPERAVPDIYGREMRVVRGGAWNTPRDAIRTTIRGSFVPSAASHSIGVRPARTIMARREFLESEAEEPAPAPHP